MYFKIILILSGAVFIHAQRSHELCQSFGCFDSSDTQLTVTHDGDIYGCTVEHASLEKPQTKFWEADINQTNISPAVFCGLGLFLGLLGVAAGTFFFVKGKCIS
ncbi:H-2 class II histocompatibility antigen, A-U alpha chain-like isoform X3 [Perca fluviatilis]|uniref:H-2 class II histocompatibility antigen, A-U alpha chain-like isoform X3 n=1 Tax=Perca fluviatilis TaxID=8168 RepID=UPI0019664499|nr:H-2 class II histocompatibility antigen, A-U alpha chain-like isoform X3 [Perca fluviatilis]